MQLVLFVCCSHATGANVFSGLLTVDFHLYLLQIGTVSLGCLSVGVRHFVTGHFAFSAYSAYLGHIYTSVGQIILLIKCLDIVTFFCNFGKQIAHIFQIRLKLLDFDTVILLL